MIKRYFRVIDGYCKFGEIDIIPNELGYNIIKFGTVSGMDNAVENLNDGWVEGCLRAIEFTWKYTGKKHYTINRISGLIVDTDFWSIWIVTVKAIEEMENKIFIKDEEISIFVKDNLR